MSPPQWINSDAALNDWLQAHLPAAALIGMDTEFMRESTYYPRLALVQLAAGTGIALLDPLACTAQGLRNALDAMPARCVLHSASEDIEALRGLLPDGPPRLYDTQIAAAFAGLGAGIGYQALVARLTGIELPKDATRSDWLQRPLNARQLDYAAQDVAHLQILHERLDTMIRARGYAAWLDEDCARLQQRAHEVPDAQPQQRLRGASGWPQPALARLRALLLWRENTARAQDVPRNWLLRDEHALDLARHPPGSLDALRERTRGLRALRSAQLAALWQHLQQPLEPDFVAATAAPGDAARPAEKRAIEALRAHVEHEAARLDLPAGLLFPRRHIEAFVAQRAWPEAAGIWRRTLLEAPLCALLPDAGAH